MMTTPTGGWIKKYKVRQTEATDRLMELFDEFDKEEQQHRAAKAAAGGGGAKAKAKAEVDRPPAAKAAAGGGGATSSIVGAAAPAAAKAGGAKKRSEEAGDLKLRGFAAPGPDGKRKVECIEVSDDDSQSQGPPATQPAAKLRGAGST